MDKITYRIADFIIHTCFSVVVVVVILPPAQRSNDAKLNSIAYDRTHMYILVHIVYVIRRRLTSQLAHRMHTFHNRLVYKMA